MEETAPKNFNREIQKKYVKVLDKRSGGGAIIYTYNAILHV